MPRLLSFDVGLRHLAFADVEFVAAGALAEAEAEADAEEEAAAMRVHRWGVIDVWAASGPASAASGPASAAALVPAVLRALDDELMHGEHALARIDHVLIENQPTRKNPMMKSVQVAIHAFFAMMRLHGLTDVVGEVHLVSPGNKIGGVVASLLEPAAARAEAPPPAAALAEGRPPAAARAEGRPQSAAASYRERKALSVDMCRRLLERDAPGALPTLMRAKKRDDLADALLQAVWFWRARCDKGGVSGAPRAGAPATTKAKTAGAGRKGAAARRRA